MKRELWLASLLAAGVSLAGEPPRATAPPTATVGPSLDTASVSNRSSLNFRNDSLDEVLDYLSLNLGFIINKETDGPSVVDLGGQVPAGWEQALASLTIALKKSGHGLTRNGRILTLTSLDRVKNADLDVCLGNDPAAVEKSPDVITQIIPVRYSSASALANNLRVLLPSTVTLSVNESANAIVLVAAKTHIRRALEVVAALDAAVASVTTIKVFHLHYADAKQLATVVQQMFGADTTNQGGSRNSNAARPGGPGGPEAAGGSETTTGGAARTRATATADESANALIVSAPESSLAAIATLIEKLDRPVTEVTELRIFNLRNADPTEIANQLAELFPDPTQSGGSQDTAASRFGGPPGPPEMQEAQAAASGSDTALKKDRVMAVPDPRTSSVMVSAPATRMPLIRRLIENLDGIAARKEMVKVWDLRNAGPQDVNQALQDLFNRNGSSRNSNNGNSLLGDNNPLTARALKQSSTTSASSSSRSSGGSGAGTGGGTGGAGGGF